MELAAGVRRALGPDGQTVALTAALTAAGAVLALHLPAGPLLGGSTSVNGWLALGVLALAFFVTELGQALVEVRRQAYSFSLSGIPLLLGLLYCPPEALVAVRIGAAAAAFAVQRAAPMKFAFNTASYLLDATLVITLAPHLTGGAPGLDLRTAVGVYAAMAVVDLLMSSVVLLVIRINSGPITGGDALEVLAPAAAFVAINTATGFVVAVLAASGGLGELLLLVFMVLTAATYRGYLVLRRRHASLQLVQEFVDKSTRATDAVGGPPLEVVLLEHIRSVLRATGAELVLDAADAGRAAPAAPGELVVLAAAADDDGAAGADGEHPAGAVRVGGRRAQDAFVVDAVDAGRSVVVTARTRDARGRRWLAATGTKDALVVALTPSGVRGAVVVTDRLGDATAFSEDDLALLQTLAGHLSVALQSARRLERLRHDATHDVLTGLPNRVLLLERMTAALAAAEEDGAGDGPAVLMLDLDRFKEVNDALGHHVGDELLRIVAERLTALELPTATVARLGGDEFAVLLERCAGEHEALAVARAVSTALEGAVDLPEATVATGASTGVAVAVPGASAADLLRHADTAMYAAKGSGDGPTAYSPAMDEGRAERMELLADLHAALEGDQLELHYQPKLDLAFGAVVGVEALVRWAHPRLGALTPDRFVPLAESTGFIEPFTQHLLAKALRQCRAWRDAGVDLSVAVNLSARNVSNPDLPELVAAALVEAGVPASSLTLEITESSVMGDPAHTVPILERLAAIGVTLSLDDFGTGYSSLSYLQRLPVRELKIDRSFVVGLLAHESGDDATAATSAALVRSITGLKESLGLRIVAEGVEDAPVLEQLRELGVDIIQGFLIGRPVPAAELDTSRCARVVLPRPSALPRLTGAE